jgi:mRNA interferase MazF
VVIVLPLTTRRRRLPSHVEIRAGTGGIHKDSYAKCEDVKSVSVERLIHKLGHVDEGVVASAGRVLRLLLDLG